MSYAFRRSWLFEARLATTSDSDKAALVKSHCRWCIQFAWLYWRMYQWCHHQGMCVLWVRHKPPHNTEFYLATQYSCQFNHITHYISHQGVTTSSVMSVRRLSCLSHSCSLNHPSSNHIPNTNHCHCYPDSCCSQASNHDSWTNNIEDPCMYYNSYAQLCCNVQSN